MDYSKWALGCLARHIMKQWPSYENSSMPRKLEKVAKANSISDVTQGNYDVPLPQTIKLIEEQMPHAIQYNDCPRELTPVFQEMFRRRAEFLKIPF